MIRHTTPGCMREARQMGAIFMKLGRAPATRKTFI